MFPNFLPNNGVATDAPEEFLKEVFSPYSRNLEYHNGKLRGRLGIQKFYTGCITDPIMHIDNYWRSETDSHLMLCTTKDILTWDSSNKHFDYLTPTITTGNVTIALTGASVAVLGSGTNWTTSLGAGDYFKFGTGSIDNTSTWYAVASVTNNTGIVISGFYAATGAALQGYTVRTIFQGTTSNSWSSCTFEDAVMGRTWIATNDVDVPVLWTGSGQAQQMAGLQHTAAKYVTPFKDRVIWANTVEGSSRQSRRARWSDVAHCQTNSATDFKDFVDEETELTGLADISDYLGAFKEDTCYVGRYTNPDDVFDFEKATSCPGCKSGKSLVKTKDSVYYYGADGAFHRWSLTEDINISSPISEYVSYFKSGMDEFVHGLHIPELSQIRWAVPYTDVQYHNNMMVYDYDAGFLEIWTYSEAQALCSMGKYQRTDTLYCDDAIWGDFYVDDIDGYWDMGAYLNAAGTILYGGYNGYLWEADLGYFDDTGTYSREFRTTRRNYKQPQSRKRLWKQQWWFESDIAGSVDIKLKKDDSKYWDTTKKVINLVSTGTNARDIIKENITWDKEGQDFQFQAESTGHIVLLGFFDYVHLKGRDLD